MKPAGREIFGSSSNEYINRIIELLDRQPGITILEIMRNIDFDNWHNRFKEMPDISIANMNINGVLHAII